MSFVGLLLLHTHCTAHVPTYNGDGCHSGCCTPPHHHTTSQVIYLEGTGGLEIHTTSTTTPFNMLESDIVDFDAVFAAPYDTSTYALFVGCGGCLPYVDDPPPIPSSRVHYQSPELEPFTQTTYWSAFPSDNRKFDTSVLINCTQAHFSVRLIDFANRTDGSQIRWGAVVGLGESFTFTELLSFPLFVLRNHGDQWNNLGWTYWLILVLATPVWWLLRSSVRACFGWKWLSPFDERMYREPRAWLYEFALVAFGAAAAEMLVHLIYAQARASWGYQFWVSLFGVVLFANGFPVAITMVTWWGLYHRADRWCIAAWWWAPVELASAFSYLFLFGAGFYVGPLLVFVAGCIRLLDDGLEWRGWRKLVVGFTAARQADASTQRRRSAQPVSAMPLERVPIFIPHRLL